MLRTRFFILIALTRIAVSAATNDTVRLDTGLISGVSGNSPEVRVYKGIPFAAPPVGDLRFRAPQRRPNGKELAKLISSDRCACKEARAVDGVEERVPRKALRKVRQPLLQ